MSSITGSNAKPRGSTVPEASPQNMKASSGSALKPTRINMRADVSPYDVGYVAAAADRGDPALPPRDLQARRSRRAGFRHCTRACARGVAGVGERDGEEACG